MRKTLNNLSGFLFQKKVFVFLVFLWCIFFPHITEAVLCNGTNPKQTCKALSGYTYCHPTNETDIGPCEGVDDGKRCCEEIPTLSCAEKDQICRTGGTYGTNCLSSERHIGNCTIAPNSGKCCEKLPVLSCTGAGETCRKEGQYGTYCTSQETPLGSCSAPNEICCKETAQTSTTTSASFSYTPLEEIPGQGKPADFPSYVKAIYALAIFTVGIAALLMVIFGGFVYVTAAGNTSQVDKGKEFIRDALLGIVLAFGSYLILYVINPDLVNIDLRSLENLRMGSGGTSGTPTGGTPYTGTSTGCQKIADTAVAMVNKQGCFYSQPKRDNHCSTNPGYFDCSSLVSYSYKQAGCTSPGNTTEDMYPKGVQVDKNKMKAGDLLIYRVGGGGHVVICVQDGCSTVAHASGTSSHPQLKISNSSSYFNHSNIRAIHASQFCSSC